MRASFGWWTDHSFTIVGSVTAALLCTSNVGQQLVRRSYWASYFPERTLIAETGSTISITLHNHLAQPHELRFHSCGPAGVDVGTGVVLPGKNRLLEFPAPPPGTYLFTDPGNQPVERILGLYGALVVIDRASPPEARP